METNSRLLLTAIMMVIIAIAAFAGGWYYAQLSVTTEPVVEQHLIIGTTDAIDSLDPHHAVAWLCVFVHPLIYDNLLRYKPGTMDIAPSLALSYSISSDGLTYTFTLREGVTFHDGSAFNATVVKESYDRLLNISYGMNYLYSSIDDVEVVDNYTVKFHLSQRDNSLLSWIGGFWGSIVNPKDVQEHPDEFGESVAGGTGPFKLVEWVRDDKIVLDANKDYWLRSPELDRITLKFYSDWSTMILALQAGEIDMIYPYMALPADIPGLKEDTDLVVKTVGNAFRNFVMDCSAFPMNNTLLRRAVISAIDFDRIISVVYGDTATKPMSYLPDFLPEYAPVYQQYPWFNHNITLATELMTQAGYPDGFSLTLYYTPTTYGPMEPDIAAVIQADLTAAGIDCSLVSLEWAAYVSKRLNLEGNMAFVSGLRGAPDSDFICYAFASSSGYYGKLARIENLTWTSTTEALLAEAKSTDNATRRLEIYQEIQRILAEQVPGVQFADVLRVCAHSKAVVGYEMSDLAFSEDWTKVAKAWIP